jgi:hypothetical protein
MENGDRKNGDGKREKGDRKTKTGKRRRSENEIRKIVVTFFLAHFPFSILLSPFSFLHTPCPLTRRSNRKI